MGTIASHRVDAHARAHVSIALLEDIVLGEMGNTFGFPPPEAEPERPSKARAGRDAVQVQALEVIVEEDKPCMGIPITNDPNATEGSTLREDRARKKELTDAQVVEILETAVTEARRSRRNYCCIG